MIEEFIIFYTIEAVFTLNVTTLFGKQHVNWTLQAKSVIFLLFAPAILDQRETGHVEQTQR